MIVVVVLVLAGLAVLGAVVVLAMGRGGELAETHPDYPPLPLGDDGRPITGQDVAYMRFPRTFWGYQMQVTHEAMLRLAYAMSERDARLADLEHQLRELRRRTGDAAEPIGALHGLEEPSQTGVPPSLHKETLGEDTADDGLADDEPVKEESP